MHLSLERSVCTAIITTSFSHMLTVFLNSLMKAWDRQRGLFDLLLWLQMKQLKKPTCTGVCGHVRVFVCVFKCWKALRHHLTASTFSFGPHVLRFWNATNKMNHSLMRGFLCTDDVTYSGSSLSLPHTHVKSKARTILSFPANSCILNRGKTASIVWGQGISG